MALRQQVLQLILLLLVERLLEPVWIVSLASTTFESRPAWCIVILILGPANCMTAVRVVQPILSVSILISTLYRATSISLVHLLPQLLSL